MKKIIVIIISFVFLGACAQTTAFLGPAITIGSTGNLMQAGFSYGTNMAVKQTTGKTPSEHVSSYVENKQKEKKIREEREQLTTTLLAFQERPTNMFQS